MYLIYIIKKQKQNNVYNKVYVFSTWSNKNQSKWIND